MAVFCQKEVDWLAIVNSKNFPFSPWLHACFREGGGVSSIKKLLQTGAGDQGQTAW